MKEVRKPLAHHLHDYFFPHERNNYRPHLFSAVSVAVLVFAIVVFEAGYLVQTKFVFLKTDFLASVLPGALVALTNQDRAVNGLAGVSEDSPPMIWRQRDISLTYLRTGRTRGTGSIKLATSTATRAKISR